MNLQTTIETMSSPEFHNLVATRIAQKQSMDAVFIPFDPHQQIQNYEKKFPSEMALLRVVGIHPLSNGAVINPYTNQMTTENYQNIGEHCISVAYCAEKIAQALQQKGLLTESDVELITARALVHDLNKPFEIMRRDAARSGLVTEDVYSVTAYDQVAQFMQACGASSDIVEYLKTAGSETGHNSLKMFIVPGEHGIERLVDGKLAEKIVHLADDMTFTNIPDGRESTVTSFLTCWERMLAAQFFVRYPFLWSEGLTSDSSGTITAVRDIKNLEQGHQLVGSYAALQKDVARRIAEEIQTLIDPQSGGNAEEFLKALVGTDRVK